MDTIGKGTTKLVNRLKTERDELRLQLHLAKEDLADDWDRIEAKWDTLERKFDAAKDGVGSRLEAAQKESAESGEDIRAAVDLLSSEISEAYQRIKSKISD